MALDKDILRQVVEASVALLRPVMEVVRDGITTGPNSVGITEEETQEKINQMSEEERALIRPEDLLRR